MNQSRRPRPYEPQYNSFRLNCHDQTNMRLTPNTTVVVLEAMSITRETGLRPLLSPALRNGAVRAMCERRLREVFWRGLPVYAALALAMLAGGWWLLGIASTRYGAADAVPEIAHYALALGLGQASALVYATARLTPAAYLDVTHRHASREWAALTAMNMDAPALVCTPWLIAGTVTAAGYWALYYTLYLAVEKCFPIMLSWLGVPFVPIVSGAFASLATLAITLPCALAGGFVAAWVTLLLASRERFTSVRRNSALGLRAYLIALGTGALAQGLMYAILR